MEMIGLSCKTMCPQPKPCPVVSCNATSVAGDMMAQVTDVLSGVEYGLVLDVLLLAAGIALLIYLAMIAIRMGREWIRGRDQVMQEDKQNRDRDQWNVTWVNDDGQEVDPPMNVDSLTVIMEGKRGTPVTFVARKKKRISKR